MYHTKTWTQRDITLQVSHLLASCKWWWACPAPLRLWWKPDMNAGTCWGSLYLRSAGQSGAPIDAPRLHSESGELCRSWGFCWILYPHHHNKGWCQTCQLQWQQWESQSWKGGLSFGMQTMSFLVNFQIMFGRFCTVCDFNGYRAETVKMQIVNGNWCQINC